MLHYYPRLRDVSGSVVDGPQDNVVVPAPPPRVLQSGKSVQESSLNIGLLTVVISPGLKVIKCHFSIQDSFIK